MWLAIVKSMSTGQLGVLQSRVHDVRTRASGTQLRDGWLNPPGLDPGDLAERTLTSLYNYNQRPTWLANAHDALDVAVLETYGWSDDQADEEVLERLLALNLERNSRVEPGGSSSDATK